MIKPRKSLLMAMLALGLAVLGAGCASEPPQKMVCPEILIPADTATLTRFKPGPGRDIIDVLHEEQITGFGHRCVFDTDETGAGEVVVEIAPIIESTIGPANDSKVAEFEYFLAVTDDERNILDKARFPVALTFPANMSRLQWQRENAITLRIPLQAGQKGEDFTIYLGLQLTPEELEYQRRAR